MKRAEGKYINIFFTPFFALTFFSYPHSSRFPSTYIETHVEIWNLSPKRMVNIHRQVGEGDHGAESGIQIFTLYGQYPIGLQGW